MAAYCGPCGRRLFGDGWAETRPWGGFTGDVEASLRRGERVAEVALCEGGHWFLWRTGKHGLETATLPYRPDRKPTWDEVLAALSGREVEAGG
jgi:hypothetical protein